MVLAGLAIGLTLLFRSPGPIPAPLPHESVIQAVRSEDGNVMVYQTREGGMTIIWVFEPRPTTVEPQASNPVEPQASNPVEPQASNPVEPPPI